VPGAAEGAGDTTGAGLTCATLAGGAMSAGCVTCVGNRIRSWSERGTNQRRRSYGSQRAQALKAMRQHNVELRTRTIAEWHSEGNRGHGNTSIQKPGQAQLCAPADKDAMRRFGQDCRINCPVGVKRTAGWMICVAARPLLK